MQGKRAEEAFPLGQCNDASLTSSKSIPKNMAMNVCVKVALGLMSTICYARCDKGALGRKEVMGSGPTLPR